MTKTLHILYIYTLLLIGAATPALAQTIKGNVYGGGELAQVVGNTHVTIEDGKLGADIFGGGEGKLNNDGTVIGSADISGATHVTIRGGEFDVKYEGGNFKQHYNIYGGGNKACLVGETHVYVTKGMLSNASAGSTNFLDQANPTGMAHAYDNEGKMYFCVFGGGYGKRTSVLGNTWVDFSISGMIDVSERTVNDNLVEYQSYLDVIGGGFNGTVAGNTNVHVGGQAMCRNVYGGGLYATIGTPDDADKGKTNVHITGGNIDNVYGGGVMGDIMTSTNVKIGLAETMTFDSRDYAVANDKITILKSVFGGNDVSGHVPTANVTHKGGTVNQNLYGAGNGDYRGYYTPGYCAYNDGENDNYYEVDHSGDTSKDSKGTKGPKGNTYKGRPQTDEVSITLGGNSDSDRAVVLGQVFGGGNSCTIGSWVVPQSGDKHDGDPHKWRDDPDFFRGGGTLNITLNSHVKIGYDNTKLAAAGDDIKTMYMRDGENVSGLFMGCSGNALATQSTDPNNNNYHHYYDSYTAKYWPGFVVYEDDAATPILRTEGLKAFYAYLNNILVKSDDVNLKIANDAEDIWLANFVGGGFRGSMQRQTEGQFEFTLPVGVTVGNCVIGGAYNTDVVYRIFETTDGHTYVETDGHYNYLTDDSDLQVVDDTHPDGDYHHIEYAQDGTTPIGIVRYYYDGGILSKDTKAGDLQKQTETITHLILANGMDASDTSKRRIFAGCFTSGTTQGNTVIDYSGTGNPRVHGGGAYAHVDGDATVNVLAGVAGDVYGGGSQADVNGSTFVNLTGGTVHDAYGGGLGQQAADAVGTEGEPGYVPAQVAVAALVGGNATVTLGKGIGEPDVNNQYAEYIATKVSGSIFGANNINGTPKGHVKVNVLKTVRHDGQVSPYNTPDNPASFDVRAVYGGGNKAAYEPAGAEAALNPANPAEYIRPAHYAEVLIANCDNSISHVYGGGNAAPVPATEVHVHGANAIDYAFAGGNGQTEGQGAGENPGADVGYLGYYSTGGATEYGAGTSHIWIYGGTVNNVFGGSNTLGYIRTHAFVDIPEVDAGGCELHVGNVHAGGNKAEMFCGGSMTLECAEGVESIYAGSNSADIYGDIVLNINSGTYGTVFGGNNESGNVHGGITINIDENGCWPIMIGRLYGCGNKAAYSVYGYYDDTDDDVTNDNRHKPRTSGEPKYHNPTINVVSCTRIDSIFGGGKGLTAAVYGNPTVNINTIKGKFAGQEVTPAFKLNANSQRVDNTEAFTIPDEVGTIGTVYGGGDAAPVYGDTRVNIGTDEYNNHISGVDTTNHPVKVLILGNVFGGSKGVSDDPAAGRVTGTTKVVIGEYESSEDIGYPM